ncbi:MAG: xylulokinase [candidate division WOR-3 bacterium]
MKPLLLGIDIGTTGAKAVLIDSPGDVLAEHTTEYPMATLRPGWAEQDPADWWQAAVRSVRQVLSSSKFKPQDIAGIGLTGQMHGLVLLDEKDKVLRPCIMWNDQRTAKQCEDINRRVGLDRIITITGKPALTGFTAGKILWVRENEPDVYARARHIQLPKDYVRLRLTGEYAIDVADASGTNLLDTGRRAWSEEVVGLLDIPLDWLPKVHECHEVVGRITAQAAEETGLLSGTPVVVGAGDQATQSVGTGIVDEGVVSVTIGTSGVVFAATNDYRPDKTGRMHAYCHAAPGRWHLMGVTLSAGGSLRWLRDTLWRRTELHPEITQIAAPSPSPSPLKGEGMEGRGCSTTEHESVKSAKSTDGQSGPDLYDLMTAEASRIPAGSEGLLFLPYLSGERCPHPDPNARGVFFGLSLRHSLPHLTRAVIEGVTFSLRDCLELLCEHNLACGRIRVSGGGSRSAFWRQVMADVFNAEVVTVNITQGAAFGAALLAGVGTDTYASAQEACARTIRETGSTKPGPDRKAYDDYYQRYRALYPKLKDEFALLADAAGRH